MRVAKRARGSADVFLVPFRTHHRNVELVSRPNLPIDIPIGLYGALAYTVTRRTNEIGLRIALGAKRRDVTRMVLTSALGAVCAGLVIGAPVAYWARGYAANVLSSVTAAQADAPVTLPIDSIVPVVLAVVAMLVVALVASYVPVRRATTVDPVVALRYD